MTTILLAAGIAAAVAIFCLGHKYGYQQAVTDWHSRKKGGADGENS